MTFLARRREQLEAAGSEEAFAERLREARIIAARTNGKWTEIAPAERLVRRGPGWLVDSETDKLYVISRGTIFAPHSANVVANMIALHFYVDEDGDVVALDPVTHPRTWSEFVERRARRAVGAS